MSEAQPQRDLANFVSVADAIEACRRLQDLFDRDDPERAALDRLDAQLKWKLFDVIDEVCGQA